MHAYDEYGRNYDMNANLNDWWSNETISGYYDQAECLIKQYEGMDLRKLGFNVRNGYNTYSCRRSLIRRSLIRSDH